jgi:hypothetical protein
MTEPRSVERLRSAWRFTGVIDDHRAGLRTTDGAATGLKSAPFMKERLKTNLRRRDLLGLAIAGAGAAAAGAVLPEPADAKPVDLGDKRKARYQPNSAEVRNFYRVNSYPVR